MSATPPTQPPGRRCPECDAVLAPDAPDGLCPQCLLGLALRAGDVPETEAAAGTSPGLGGFADYDLLAEIGHGGMGVVYRARQRSLNRVVALKMLLGGQFADPQARARFRAEAEIAAGLQHPNIVAIHEVGEHDRLPFFTMDYVEGQSLADLARERPLTAQSVAGYLQTMALAIQYAHAQGVLHRDLKPSNILIDASDQPRITDFGLAKRLTGSTTNLTLSSEALGSPNFMPPEQAAGKHRKIGPASDVYGLGAILYYLLTSRPPFLADNLSTAVRQVQEEEPVAPRLLNPGVPRDLETICLKCLQKQPAQRYASARELAEELGRFLKGEPIQARPIGVAARTWRWCRRRPELAVSLGACVAVFAAGFVGVTWQWRRAEQLRRVAETQRETQRALTYASDMRIAYDAVEAEDLISAASLLEQWLPRAGEPDLRGFEWRLIAGRGLEQMGEDSALELEATGPLALSPDGEILAVAGQSKVRLVRISSRQLAAEIAAPYPVITCLAFSPDGTLLAIGSDRVERSGDEGKVELWNWQARELIGSLSVRGPQFAFSPSARNLCITEMVGEGRPVLLWDYSRPDIAPLQLDHWGGYPAFTPDGSRMFAALPPGAFGVAFWDTRSWQPARTVAVPRDLIYSLAVSADGRWGATGHLFGTVLLWDLTNCSIVRTQRLGNALIQSVAFSPDSQQLAACGHDGAVTFLSVADPSTRVVKRTKGGQLAVQYLPGGRSVVTSAGDRLLFWSSGAVTRTDRLEGIAEIPVLSLDHSRVAMLTTNRECLVLEMRTLQPVSRIAVPLFPMAFSADGQTLLGVFAPKQGDPIELQFWDLESGRRTRAVVLEDSRALNVDGIRDGLPRSFYRRTVPSGLEYLVIGSNRKIWMWRTSTGRLIRSWSMELAGTGARTRVLRFTPDGKQLVSTSEDGTVAFWSVPEGELRSKFNSDGNAIDAAFTSDNTRFAVAGGGPIRIYNRHGARLLAELRGHDGSVFAIGFSPDGQRLVSAGGDQTIRIWDLATGRETAVLNHDGGNVSRVWFMADGIAAWWRLAERFQVWRAPSFAEIEQSLTNRVRQLSR